MNKNSQSNTLVELIHQVIYSMIFTKDLDRKVYDYTDPWGKIIASVALKARASYHHTLGFTPDQYAFGRYVLLNLISIDDL